MILNWALASPLWTYVLIPQARAKIVSTAEANGIPWKACTEWIQSNMVEWPLILPTTGGGVAGAAGAVATPMTRTEDQSEHNNNGRATNNILPPDYYRQAFHAYPQGNLCWEAAWEVEIASCAVGARNFPQYGSHGEDAFRGAFESALREAGAYVPSAANMIDLGCGTGMSTRRLARCFPQASIICGMDLSPYYIEVGKRLLQLEPKRFNEPGGTWVSTVTNDERIEYCVGNAANTQLGTSTYDIVNIQFVLHEVPAEVARQMVDEAYRLLKPSGQLWICEMDFEAPAYAAQRANALLFSLIRATEPYLDDYAESISDLFQYIANRFTNVTVVPATGRHFALVATKDSASTSSQSFSSCQPSSRIHDFRFHLDGTYRVEDTHLQLWESKRETSQ